MSDIEYDTPKLMINGQMMAEKHRERLDERPPRYRSYWLVASFRRVTTGALVRGEVGDYCERRLADGSLLAYTIVGDWRWVSDRRVARRLLAREA